MAWKMGLAISLLILVGMTLLATLLLKNQLTHMRSQADRFGSAIALQLAHTAREPLLAEDQFQLKVQIHDLVSSDSIKGAALYSRDGRRLDQTGLLPPNDAAAGHRTDGVQRWDFGDGNLSTYFAPIRVHGKLAGTVAVTLSNRPILSAQRQIRDTMVTATLIMGLLAILASFLIARWLARPIRELLHAASALRKGDLKYRLRKKRNDEIGHLAEAYNSMAHSLLEKDQVERVLRSFVSPAVARNMMDHLDRITLGGHDVTATVVFADIVGFTRISETLAPDAIADMLNVYFDAVSTAAAAYRGMIDKYMGDCVMVVFGVAEDDPEHRFHGLCCAVMIQRLVARLNRHRAAHGRTTAEFRIGINSGAMLAGNLGSRERMQHTVVGDAVNLASRLSNMATAGEIVASGALLDDPNIGARVRAGQRRMMRVRGRREPVATWCVEGVHARTESIMERRIAQFLATLP